MLFTERFYTNWIQKYEELSEIEILMVVKMLTMVFWVVVLYYSVTNIPSKCWCSPKWCHNQQDHG